MIPKLCGPDRLRVLFHRRQQFGDARMVHSLDAEESAQRLMRASNLVQNPALDGGRGEAAKFSDERPHRAASSEVAVPGGMGGEIALQAGLVVPVGDGWIARAPFVPSGIGRLLVDEFAAGPRAADRKMWVEPDIGAREICTNCASRSSSERRSGSGQ